MPSHQWEPNATDPFAEFALLLPCLNCNITKNLASTKEKHLKVGQPID
jgi:hypothetical protein